MKTKTEIRYIYRNYRGGWSIACDSAAEVGNYGDYIEAVNVASMACSHVRDLDFNSAIELSRTYRDKAERQLMHGDPEFGTRCQFWSTLMEIQATKLAPADEVARMRGEAAETAARNATVRVAAAS